MSYKVQKACKICGKLYTPCSDCENDKTSFHWRTVACSRECGMKYFKKIEESRNGKTDNFPLQSEDIELTNTKPSVTISEEIIKPKRTRKK